MKHGADSGMSRENLCVYKQLQIKQGIVRLKLKTFVSERNIRELSLGVFDREKGTGRSIAVPVRKKQTKEGCILEAELDLKMISLDTPEWVITCRIMEQGAETEIPCLVTSRIMRKLFYLKDISLRYISDLDEIYFLLLASDYTVHLVHRKHCRYDDRKYRWKECAAKLWYSATKKWWDKKKIWIFFEKECKTAQDNGYYFYKYCIEHKKEQDVEMYYILDQEHPDMDVLRFYSWKYMMYLQAADLLVSSESREQAVVWRNRNSFLRDMLAEKPLFFLQHGIIGLKCLPHFHKNRECSCSYFITSSEYERKLVVDYLGYTKEETAVTGLARYDWLEDKSGNESVSYILVMPTWREWLDDISEDGFLESDFFRIYQTWISDIQLRTFLEKSDTVLRICMHPKAQRYISCFHTDCARVEFLSYEKIKLNEELMKAKLLLTDYSSVAWDMLYMNKPVVFFQFDEERYMYEQGAYIDFKTGLFGRQVKDTDTLTETLTFYEQRGYRPERKYEELKNRYFQYHDRNHCRRIYQVLKNYWEQVVKDGKNDAGKPGKN